MKSKNCLINDFIMLSQINSIKLYSFSLIVNFKRNNEKNF